MENRWMEDGSILSVFNGHQLSLNASGNSLQAGLWLWSQWCQHGGKRAGLSGNWQTDRRAGLACCII